jgi:mannitol/fructose-specific phosphotransferase system IIA component (Ntr-type)
LIEVVMHAARAACAPPPRLSELFPPEAIRIGLAQRSKAAVIEALVHHAVVLGYLSQHEEPRIVARILARESLASTALGHGIAMPHCQWDALDRFIGVAGLLRQGIPFDAADGQPVDGVFLTLAPADHAELSFEVLGRLVAVGRNSSLRLLLRECQTAEQVFAFLQEIDRPAAGHLDDLARLSLTRVSRDRRDPWRDLAYYSLTQEDRDPEGGGLSDQRWL